MRDIEKRHIPAAVEIRGTDDTRKIVGYAAVFDSLSEDLGGFREIIKPGAFDRALKESHDVRALLNHNHDMVLGRTKSGTLRLEADKKGLLTEIDPPDTQVGRDVVASVKRGDLDGMSFAFRVLSDEWRTEAGEPLREVRDLELLDVSVVAFPAYPATQVSARAIEQARASVRTVPVAVLRRALDLRRKLA